jgi:hypothetical protein
MLGRPDLGDEGRSGRPLAAHAQPEHEAEEGELGHALRQATGEARERVDQDRRHQRAGAAHAVGNHPECQAADGGSGERERVQEPGLGLAEPEVEHQLREHHGIEHHVHGVEHPAQASRDQRASLRRADRLWPGEAEDAAGAVARMRRVERVHGNAGL